ncbi:efflux RND transporter periplasmic adaptor subunit [Bacillus tuaregi]|uniref:efflux RND transporter periplasmic adaptor subunit n=1 Tax=Bacillus tuaregi TaxID=1816695 RepID=UPI0008F7F153|nr:efflux RND transporter periplasmic adaptor subunit [Bacillus tuaregi]
MKKKIWIAIGVSTLILVMAGVSVYRQYFAKGPEIKTEQVKMEEISSLLLIPGTLQLQDEQIEYLSLDKGELQEILVQEGQQVKKDDPIARLSNNQLQLEVEQNKLAVESGYLKINQLQKQEKGLDKQKEEMAKEIGEKKATEELSPQYNQLDVDLKMANLDVRQLLLQKESLEKRVQELEIKSKIDGTVLSINEVAGASINGQEPFIQIGSIDGMVAKGVLSEYDTLKVATGQKVYLSSDAVPNEKWEGEITNIGVLPVSYSSLSGQGETQAVQYPVTISITSESIALKPGFQVIMEIETEKKKSLVVSEEAIQDDGNPYVYVLDGNIARRQDIKMGITSGGKIEIVKGLKAKQQIILDPSEGIKDGMEVRKK